MTKRLSIALVLVLVITSMTFSGAFAKKSSENANIKNIVVWTHVPEDSPDAKVYQQRIKDFNKQFSGKYSATVEFIPRNNSGGGYLDKINAAVASNSLPDVATCDGPDTAAWALSKILVPIDKYVSKEEKDSYVESIIAQGTYKGKLYALSNGETSVAIYYNKDLFAKSGITPATFEKPWTWTGFEANARKLKDAGVKYPFSMNAWEKTEWGPYAFLGFFWSNGGDAMNANGKFEGTLNSAVNVKTGKFLAKLSKDKLMPITTIDAAKEFRAGSLAMYLSGPWELGNLRAAESKPSFEWDIMPYPIADGWKGGRYTPCGSWSLGVTSAAKDKAAAAELVKWMTNKDSSKLFAEMTGNLPSHKSLVNLFEKDPIMTKLIQQNVKTAHVRPVTPYYPIFREGFLRAVEGIFNGRDVKQSLDDGVKYINGNIR